MAALYELSAQYNALLERLYDDELPSEVVLDSLEGLEGEIADKAENIAALIGTLSADIAAIKADEERQAKRRKPLENQVERLKSYLLGVMVNTGNSKLETTRFRISVRNNPESVQVEDESAIPRDYFREVPAKFEVDKTLVKQAMKDGFAVPGCTLKRSQSLQIK